MVAARTTVQREAMVTCNSGVGAEGGREEAIEGGQAKGTGGSRGKEDRDGGG